MAGKVLELDNIITKDNAACAIADQWTSWNTARQGKIQEWDELRKYIFAVDTTSTTNSKLPWQNKTTLPKLCQIRDNLYANYVATLFPKRDWVLWEGANEESTTIQKIKTIQNYMYWVLDQPEIRAELDKLILDYIDYGNCFVTVDWQDDRVEDKGRDQYGYVGPVLRRISPLDIVMNPLAPDVEHSPKIVRSLITLGEAEEYLTRLSKDPDEQKIYQALFDYMVELRGNVAGVSELQEKDDWFLVDGFDSFHHYLNSGYVEVLTFYGDYYDDEKKQFYRNHKCVVVDRHKMVYSEPLKGFLGTAPIYHAGWRIRQDNLWAMGPLDNLVGMQYRIDHLENLKADVFDQIAAPMIAVSGYVEDFDWEPFGRIYLGDDGKVEVLAPQAQAATADNQIQLLEMKMEEMAGAPKEAMGFRTPGEKTKYEVQRLENAASRVFYNKIISFETKIVEPALNAMLELARRRMDQTMVRVIDEEFDLTSFQQLTKSDITGSGRIRPVAAKHFAEQAELIQNMTQFMQTGLAQVPQLAPHWSGIKMSQMFEKLLGVERYGLVTPFIVVAEQAEQQKYMMAAQEQNVMEGMTPSGLNPDDYDEDMPMEASDQTQAPVDQPPTI